MFNFKSNFAVHAGNTKYYQVISIINERNAKGCVITNWGKYTPGEVREPKNKSHATKIDCYANNPRITTNNHCNKIATKTANRYDFSKHDTVDFTLVCDSELLEFLPKWFKTDDVELIYNHLFDGAHVPSTFFNEYNAKAITWGTTPSFTDMRESPKMLDRKLNEENEKAANLRLAVQEKEARDFEKNELLQNLGWGLF